MGALALLGLWSVGRDSVAGSEWFGVRGGLVPVDHGLSRVSLMMLWANTPCPHLVTQRQNLRIATIPTLKKQTDTNHDKANNKRH